MIARHPTNACEKSSKSNDMTVEVVHDINDLETYVAAWQELASNSIEPNVFYEPWFLMPAIRAFGADADLTFVLVFNAKRGQPPTLCGFFPLERKRGSRGLPVPILCLWKHMHCYSTTPLIHKDAASKVVRTFLEWLRTHQRGCPVLELPRVSGDGRFLQEITTELWPEDIYVRSYTRALIHARDCAETYLKSAISGNRRRELRRMRKRLDEKGIVQSALIEHPHQDLSVIDRFLKLEASGWKGRDGVAMSCDDRCHQFFREIAVAGMDRGQLHFSCLLLDDRPIAMSCDLVSSPGCFAFKIAFDESYASFAPGIMLALDRIQLIHSRPDISWMDSCTAPGNKWVDRLWSDKKTVTTMLIPTGTFGSQFAIGLFPLLHWMKRKVRGK